MMRIHTKAFAFSCGITFGAVVLIKTLLARYTGMGADTMTLMSSCCPGYSVSIGGSVIGFFYGLIKGMIIGGFIAFIYNKLFVRI